MGVREWLLGKKGPQKSAGTKAGTKAGVKAGMAGEKTEAVNAGKSGGKKKRGRPPIYGKRMSDTEYKRRWRAKKKM